MSSSRGRTLKLGGVAYDVAGASGRTEGPAQAPQVRTAYASPGGGTQFRPTGVAVSGLGGVGGGALLDLSTITGWRLIFTLAAAAYLGFWFVTLGRGGISGGVRL